MAKTLDSTSLLFSGAARATLSAEQLEPFLEVGFKLISLRFTRVFLSISRWKRFGTTENQN